MKILWLDDDSVRNSHALKYFKRDTVDVAVTASEAIQLLTANSPYDLVSLDHDLGDKQMQRSEPGTGYEVALFITEMSDELLPKEVIVHSYNPVGAQNMMSVLRQRKPGLKIQYKPFDLSPKHTNY